MPIIAPESTPDRAFYERLESCGALVISHEAADRQDIRPARIGLLNLMPAQVMEATEVRWLRFMSHTVLQIEPVLMKFDDDRRETATSSRRNILERYQPFSTVREAGLDGLIITGDNQERRIDGSPQPFNELYYAADLRKVIDWADDQVGASIYSCLASHFALQHRYGLTRSISEQKTFGIYRHEIFGTSPTIFAMDDSITAPHSRWGDVSIDRLVDAEINVIAAHESVGWLIAEVSSAGNTSTYMQGHPEYWRYDLHEEYLRDQQAIPENYYPDDDLHTRPTLSWSNDARSLFSNWIQNIYTRYSA